MHERLETTKSRSPVRIGLACLIAVGLVACRDEAPPAAPAAPRDDPAIPAPAPSPAPAPGATQTAPAARAPIAAPPSGAAPPAGTPAPAPSPAADHADDGQSPLPTRVKPGDIVRETHPRTPEHVIQQVLVAALDPDEAKGWERFKSLLHTDELHPNGLVTRRSMNFAASRRKVDLFLVEQGEVPVFQVSRLIDEGQDTLRFFVHNKESMPTPCTARIDHNLDPPSWRVGICSL
jgi:hypothetical protein